MSRFLHSHPRFALTLSIASILLSVFTLCLFLYREDDNCGVSWIISALTLLVSVIIGWQIYVLLDLRDYQTKFEDLEQRFRMSQNQILGFNTLGYADMNIKWLTPAPKEEWFKNYLTYSIEAVHYFSKAKDYQRCWSIVSGLISTIEGGDPALYGVLKSSKADLLCSLLDIESPLKIDNLKDLINLVKNV